MSVFFRQGHLLALSIVIILVAGFSAIQNLPRLEDPRIDLRNVMVLTQYPGASAERVEALVTDVLEDELRELYEIKKIESTSSAGFSSVSVELQDWIDGDSNEQVFSKIRDSIEQASRLFPQGAQPPFLEDKRGATAFTYILSFKKKAGQDLPLTAIGRMATELSDRLRNVSGTELIRVYGAPEEEILVEIAADKLASAGLSMAQASALVASADPKLPAGSVISGTNDIRIQVADTLDAVQTVRDIPLIVRGADTLRLGDIATVSKGWRTPERNKVFVDSERTIMLAARMQTTVRVDKWTERITQQVDKFKNEYGSSIDVEVVFEQNVYTQARLNELTNNLIMGCAVVVAVILLFMGLKASLIVGLALPMCASFALFSLSFFGEQIHQMSIFGIIIAIGLLIDNAIVITDEIRLNLLNNKLTRLGSLQKSINHLFVPLLASTLTTILGFMPIFLLNGNIGDFIGPIAISVVMALIGSLFISLTVIAALAARYLPRTREQNATWLFKGIDLPNLSAAFKGFLFWVVNHPKRIIVSIVVFCLSGFILSQQLGNVFFPSADRDQFEIYVWTDQSSGIEKTHAEVMTIDKKLQAYEDIEQVTWMIGASAPSVYYNQVMRIDNKSNYANGVITVSDAKIAANIIGELQRDLTLSFPHMKIVVRAFGQGPPISAPVEVEVYGPDLETLNRLGQQVRLAMSQVPEISESVASITFSEPELVLETSRDATAQTGTDLTAVASQLQASLQGVTNGSILQGTEDIPVRVRVRDEERSQLDQLASLPLITQATQAEQTLWANPLSLGDFALKPAISGITRLNGERQNSIKAYLLPGATALDVSVRLREILNEQLQLPSGYRLKLAGDADEQASAIGQLATYLPVLLVLMITTLILSFSSVRMASIIGTVAILSVGLGFFSLWISGLPIGFNPLLGSAGLIGVTINGSIVVIAAIRANKQARSGDKHAIVEETMSCSRHILSTTLTTVGGLVPLLILSEGSFWPPLAVVLAGGVGFSVILSLLFTPAILAFLTRHAKEKHSLEVAQN